MFLLFSFTRTTYNYRHYQFKSSALQELNTLSFPSTVPCRGKVLKHQTMFVPFLKGSRGSKIGIARFAVSCNHLLQRIAREKLIAKKPMQVQNYWLHSPKWYYRNTGKGQVIQHVVTMCPSRCRLSPTSKRKCSGAGTMFLLPQWSIPALCLRLWTLLN